MNVKSEIAYRFPMGFDDLDRLFGFQKAELFVAGAADVLTEAREHGWLDEVARTEGLDLADAPLSLVLDGLKRAVEVRSAHDADSKAAIEEKIDNLLFLEDTLPVKRLHNIVWGIDVSIGDTEEPRFYNGLGGREIPVPDVRLV